MKACVGKDGRHECSRGWLFSRKAYRWERHGGATADAACSAGRCSALRGRMQHAAMTDAAHCDNEATIVPPKVDGAAFPKGEVWRTEGRKPDLSGQKTLS